VRHSQRQRAAQLLDTLAHANQTKPIMAISRGESFTIIRELQSKFLLVEVEARFESASAYSLGFLADVQQVLLRDEHRNLICFLIKREMSCVESSSRDL
jgi:hypothetical protein